MQTSTKVKKRFNKSWKQPLYVVAFLLVMLSVARIGLDIGEQVNLTFQTLVLCVFFYYTDKKWRLIGVLLYLLLGIAGLPMFNGGDGWSYFSKLIPFAFFTGFVVSAFIKNSTVITWHTILTYFIQVHLTILAFGLIGIMAYSKEPIDSLVTISKLVPAALIKSVVALGVVLAIAQVKKIFSHE